MILIGYALILKNEQGKLLTISYVAPGIQATYMRKLYDRYVIV